MKFPANHNPNPLPILTLGCASAFLLPFAIRFANAPLILLTMIFATGYLAVAYSIAWRNYRTNQTWIRENKINAITCREAIRIIETSSPTELQVILKLEDWPLSFCHMKPRALMVDGTGNKFWICWRFTPQIQWLLAVARRRHVPVEHASAE